LVGKDKRPLLKTPSVNNLERFFELFPDASLLIVIRDGRSVVESGVRSFGWSYEAATRAWVDAAQRVASFQRIYGSSEFKWRIVRYEDLVTGLDRTLLGVLSFLGLDASQYDMPAARALPVVGSSSFRGGERDVHWAPVTKTERFQPLERWQDWSQYRQQRFYWLARDMLQHFDYPVPESRQSRVWAIANVLLAAPLAIWSKLGMFYYSRFSM
jgi:hypothetical protein